MYEIKLTVDVSGDSHATFVVDNPAFQPLATLMVSDVRNFGDIITSQIALAQEEEETELFMGNVCSLEIGPQDSLITDELSPDGEHCIVPTALLLKAIQQWEHALAQ